jgi:hypothetical protein
MSGKIDGPDSRDTIGNYGNYFDAATQRTCNMHVRTSVVSGSLPPGLAIYSAGDSFPGAERYNGMRSEGGGIYGASGISGKPTTAGTYEFTIKHSLSNDCHPTEVTATKKMTIVIANPDSRDPEAPVIRYFKAQVLSLLSQAADHAAFLRSDSSYVVPKDLKLRFTVQTNCEISREAWYYTINADGTDLPKKYELQGDFLNNLCENNRGHSSKGFYANNYIEVSPQELGLSEGTHKIVIRGCTKDGHCSPVSDGLPICTGDYCQTTYETDKGCTMN